MGWTFFWLMVALKVPIAALFYIVHWAIKQSDADAPTAGNDGGIKPSPHRPRVPRHPRRRGPHGAGGAGAGGGIVPRFRPPAVTARARSGHRI
jgi:hypothetical protein